MGEMPRPKCRDSRCLDRAEKGSRWCKAHQPSEAWTPEKKRNPFYDSTAWRELRARVLALEPLCRMCANMGRVEGATMVDHILEISLGGKALDINNLQPLCMSCHRSKTRKNYFFFKKK